MNYLSKEDTGYIKQNMHCAYTRSTTQTDKAAQNPADF